MRLSLYVRFSFVPNCVARLEKKQESLRYCISVSEIREKRVWLRNVSHESYEYFEKIFAFCENVKKGFSFATLVVAHS